MSTGLMVDSQNQLQEFRDTGLPKQPAALRIIATMFSYIFHPLFVPVYISWFLVSVQPYLFASFTIPEKMIVVIRFFVLYSFFPLVTVLLLKALGFIKSIQLKTQKERIIPYIACGLYYFWMWYVLRNQLEFPKLVVVLAFAIFFASSMALMANIYMKVSMHAISMGVMVAFIFLLAFNQGIPFGIYISAALLIAGLVCTARFIVSDHTPKEVYTGLALGITAELLANWWMG